MHKKIKIIGLIIMLVLVSGGSFYGGMLYKTHQLQGQRTGLMGSRTSNRFTAGANFISGDITARDAQSITVKMRDGSSRIIFYSTTTDVGKFTAGSMDDLQIGKTVMVNGKTNSDGSVTAQSIQIRPLIAPMPAGQ